MLNIEDILFIDIETATLKKDYDSLPESLRKHWDKKSKILQSRSEAIIDEASYYKEKAAIYAEFGKIVCISIGCFRQEAGEWRFVLKSIVDKEEKVLLKQFYESSEKFTMQHPSFKICGHNIKEFDIPFLCRRMIIHALPLPAALQLQGMKPWEVPHLDTLELWKFGDYKNFTSLALLADILNIPTPKDDIDGSMVSALFWEEGDLDRISTYCMKDVFTTAKIYLRLIGRTDIEATPYYL